MGGGGGGGGGVHGRYMYQVGCIPTICMDARLAHTTSEKYRYLGIRPSSHTLILPLQC